MTRHRIILISPIGNHRGWRALKALEDWAKANRVSTPSVNRQERLLFLYGALKSTAPRGQRCFLLIMKERRGVPQHKSYYKAQLGRWGFLRKGVKKKMAGAIAPTPSNQFHTFTATATPYLNQPPPSTTVTGVSVGGSPVYPSMEAYLAALQQAELNHAFEQQVIADEFLADEQH